MKIEKYKKNGKDYYKFTKLYLGIDPFTGKEIRKSKAGFKTKKAAELYIAKLRTEVDEKGLLSNQANTFRNVYNLFYEGYKHTIKESTLLANTYTFNLLLEKLGAMDIKKISITHCQKLINDTSKVYSISAVKRLKTYGSMIFEHAIRMRLIHDNPMSHVLIPKKQVDIHEDDTKYYYTVEELKKFLELVHLKYGEMELAMFRLLAFTGMRKGELQALTWNDIDFINNTVNITKTLALNMDKKVIVQSPKSKSSVRKISIDDTTSHLLKKWKIKQKEMFFKKGIRVSENQMCFTNPNTNKMLDLIWLNRKMNQLCKEYDFKQINIHGFRHTHCSLMFESGATIQEVQNRLGHSDLKTTMGIYAHVTQKQKDNLANKFAKYVNF